MFEPYNSITADMGMAAGEIEEDMYYLFGSNVSDQMQA